MVWGSEGERERARDVQYGFLEGILVAGEISDFNDLQTVTGAVGSLIPMAMTWSSHGPSSVSPRPSHLIWPPRASL